MHSIDLKPGLAVQTHILVVEDDPPQRELIEILLRDHSVNDELEIMFATSLVETLEMLGRLPIDVVLLDLTLPDARGTVTFEAVCQNYPRIPVIVLTGNPSESLLQDALSSGAQDFLSKDAALSGDGLLLYRTVKHSIERMRARQRLVEAEREIMARRYNAEIQKLREQSILGELVTIMSQQLTAPLSAISSYEAALRSQLELASNPNAEMLLESIQRETHSAIEIVRQMRQRIRKPQKEAELIDLSELLDRVISNLRQCGPEMQTSLRFSVPNDKLTVKGDPFQLEQMFIGLVRNGIEAVEHRGPDGIVGVFCKLRNQEITIEIDDNGPTLSDEVFARLEEPFFTTKPKGSTVGMGITMARSIVELHGGVLVFRRRLFKEHLVDGLQVQVRLPQSC
ncbi:MAG: hybrid sensor histidine kinase/response regulator [Planctomycetota bacterium]